MTPQEKAILAAINAKLSQGIMAAITVAAEGYREKVTAFQSPPTSDEGEFPHEDTGQGAENIAYGLGRKRGGLSGPEGRFGLFGEETPIPRFPGQDHDGGEHLDWLRQNQGRLGMDTSFAEDLNEVRAAAHRAITGGVL